MHIIFSLFLVLIRILRWPQVTKLELELFVEEVYILSRHHYEWFTEILKNLFDLFLLLSYLEHHLHDVSLHILTRYRSKHSK